jgi:hypothetical protein
MLRSCSICNAGREVASAIENAVRNRERFRDIEKRCGFSKSLISKHMRRCVPELNLQRTKPVDFSKTRVLITFDPTCGGFPDDGHRPVEYFDWLRSTPVPVDQIDYENDIVMEVSYEKPVDLSARAAEVAAVRAKTEAALKPTEIPVSEKSKTTS